MADRKAHWDAIFKSKPSPELTWYQPHLARSLELIRSTGLKVEAPILDIGCGDSTLVDDLLESGFTNLTVLDVSSLALERSRERLGWRASQATWIEGDVPAQKPISPPGAASSTFFTPFSKKIEARLSIFN